MLIAHH